MSREPVKILHILTEKTAGGAGRQLSYLISESDGSRFSHAVVLPEGAESAERLRAAGAEVIFCPGLRGSFCPRAARALFRIIKSNSPDIVHTHSSFTGRLAARRARVPATVMTKHCSDMPPKPLTRFPLRLFSRLHLSLTADAAIATDESAAAALIAEGMPRNRIKLIYNGSPRMRETSAEEREELRRRLGIPDGTICVGLFSRLEPAKGALQFVQAAALCLAQADGIFFIVCGKGSLEQTMREAAERYGAAGRIIFAGYASDPAPYMNICSVIVSPSLGNETSSLSLCEGMSLGLVPVVTDVGGSARLIGGAGRVVPPDDPPALADAILELCRDPDLCRIFSDRAPRRYAERCTSARMSELTHLLYEQLLEKKS